MGIDTKPRVLCVACDGIGLGHVSRQLGIARHLRRLRPDAEILFLTSSEAANLIWQEGFASVKVPSLELNNHPADHRLSLEHLDKIVPNVIDGVLAGFQPTVTVVDTFPYGFRGEYAPILRFPTRRILVQRELSNFESHPNLMEILGRYEKIVAPYDDGDVTLRVPPGTMPVWTGPILVRDTDEFYCRDEARAKLGLPQEGAICLLSFGGGGHKNSDAIDGWFRTVITQHPTWHFALLSPPLADSRRKKPYPENAQVIAHYPLMECLRAFDGAVAGSGSLQIELACAGVPAVVLFDRDKVDEDQPEKTALYSSDGKGLQIAQFDSAALAQCLTELHDDNRRAELSAALKSRHGKTDGARKAAQEIVSMLENPS